MKHSRHTRKAVVALAVAGVMVALAGCSSGTASGDSGGSANAKVTLWARSDDSTFIQPLVKSYNASHKSQVQLTLIPAGASFTQKVGSAVASHSGPDLVSLNLVYAPYFANANTLLDVSSKLKALPYAGSLNKSETNLGTWNGKSYAVPFTGDASVLFYNKTLFKQAGIATPPTNWTEIEADAKKITALGGGKYGYYFPGSGSGWNLFTFTPFIWADGGNVLSGEGAKQKATLTDPAVSDALTFYRQLWTDGVIPKSAQTDDGTSILTLFEAGKVGMVANGAFAYSDLKSKFPNLDYGVTPIPGKTGNQASFAGGDTLAITKDSTHSTAAWNFIKWATSKSVQEKLAEQGVIPVRPDAVPSDASATLKGLVTAMANGQTPKSTVYSQLFEDPQGPWANLLHNAIFTGDIQTEINKAQGQWTTILKTGK
jgi:multiple sugar transport system substrate-binding protein